MKKQLFLHKQQSAMENLFISKKLSVQEGLAQFHLSELRKTLLYVKRYSRFYQTHLRDYKIEDIVDIQNFRQLPFTLPQHIKESSLSFLCVSQDDISRITTTETSGTTGIPKRIFFTSSDLENTVEFFSFVMSQLTNHGESVMILLPGTTPSSVGDLLKTAVERIGVKGIIEGFTKDLSQTVISIENHQPSSIIGMPIHVSLICKLIKEKNIGIKSVNHVILTSDYVSSVIKEQVKEILNCQVFDHYGMTETGFGGAIDCFAHKGYHIREFDLYFEIVDPDSGDVLNPGDWGEVVITTLNRQGMPLVRYRTGDISRFIQEPCVCKSLFRLMDYIQYNPKRLKPYTIELAMD